MKIKAASGIMLTLLLTSMSTLAFNVQLVRAGGTVYIGADGSIEPLTANITSLDNVTYTFTGNIYDSIVVERDNIVVDGAGYTVQGTGSGTGIELSGRSNVTIKNVEIKLFYYGIWLRHSSNNSIYGNKITNSSVCGVGLVDSSNYNSIYGNKITNNEVGISLLLSSNNTISGNNITDSGYYYSPDTGFGISLTHSLNNSVYGNKITNSSVYGINLHLDSNCNSIYGNNVTDNVGGIGLRGSSNNSIYGNKITNNGLGIDLSFSSNNTISGNNVTNNKSGIWLDSSNYNSISGNNVTNNGIYLRGSSNNSVYGNKIRNSIVGVGLDVYSNYNSICGNKITNSSLYGIGLWFYSNNNSIYENNITNNNVGIDLEYSKDNAIYYNNFINNTNHVYIHECDPAECAVNTWDNGVKGNYWSNYTGADANGNGIGDTPYEINENNIDRYPLMNPWSPPPTEIPLWMQWWFWTIVITGIAVLAGAVYFLKKRKPPTPTAPTPLTEDIV